LSEIPRITFSLIIFSENNSLHLLLSKPIYLVYDQINYLGQNLIISSIDNLIVYCEHNKIELGGQNSRQNLIV